MKYGPTTFTPRKMLLQLTLRILSNSSSVTVVLSFFLYVVPALLTTMSRPPHLVFASCKASVQDAVDVQSKVRGMARLGVKALISVDTREAAEGTMSVIITVAPSWA